MFPATDKEIATGTEGKENVDFFLGKKKKKKKREKKKIPSVNLEFTPLSA